METVFFSLYYPISPNASSSKPRHPWLGDPVSLVADGIVRSANSTSISPDLVLLGLNAIRGIITIPAEADVPISNLTNTSFPILLFSHGDGSIRTWYSQYLGLVAAQGYVVGAVEHRDGSAAGSVVVLKGGASRNVAYITPDQLG